MFDTIAGLPIHPLVVHAVVVLLPLACLATVAIAVRRSWWRFAPWLVVLNAGVLVATFVAKESGERLEARISQFTAPEGLDTHTLWGGRLFLLAVAMLVAALILALLNARGGFGALGGVLRALVVVAALVTVGVTGVVGHSGATAVWKATIESTTP